MADVRETGSGPTGLNTGLRRSMEQHGINVVVADEKTFPRSSTEWHQYGVLTSIAQ